MSMTTQEIMEILPHRQPFLLIDTVEEVEPGVRAVAKKNVTFNEPYFAGHFPDTPIMPGVLLIESAAQLCSLVISSEENSNDDKIYVLLKVKDFKFLKPVIPGDTLIIDVSADIITAGSATFSAIISVDGKVRAKGSMLFTAIPRNSVYE